MSKNSRFDIFLTLGIFLLLATSIFVLRSIIPSIFPGYVFVVLLAVILFIVFSLIDFDILSLFSRHFYIGSIILLLITLIAGRLTRGVVRWIPLGVISLQAAEVIKPFLLVFFANYLINNKLDGKGLRKAALLMFIPLILIFIQPSLGVTFLLAMGFVGLFLSVNIEKKYFLYAIGGILVLIPIVWLLLAPYQKSRIEAFLNPYSDPLGKGYNSIQSVITVGSGGLLGRGLGRGVQTQLSFLPEKHTDFVFAAISEELGFVGSMFVILVFVLILWRIAIFMGHAKSPEARAYLSGFFLTLLSQIVIHIGMNLGLLPITGVPLPLVSSGGSSLVATMIGLGIALGARKKVAS